MLMPRCGLPAKERGEELSIIDATIQYLLPRWATHCNTPNFFVTVSSGRVGDIYLENWPAKDLVGRALLI